MFACCTSHPSSISHAEIRWWAWVLASCSSTPEVWTSVGTVMSSPSVSLMSNTVRTGKNVLVVVFSSVAPRYQGRGVGFRLIAALVNWAQRAGFCELYLDTGADERARGIYRRHGFITLEFDEHHRDYLMGCSLRRSHP